MEKFKDLVVDVWQQGFMGIAIDRLFISIIVFAIFFGLRHFLAETFIFKLLGKLAKKASVKLDEKLSSKLEPPVHFIPIVFGAFLALDVLNLDESGVKLLGDKVVRSLVIFNLFWLIYRGIEPFLQLLRPLEKKLTSEIVDWALKAVRVLLVFFAVASILELWGIKVGALIAGLGLFGLAGALGAQDLVKNIISGVLIIAENRFKKGDWILVDGVVEGTVEIIGFRSTLVRRFDQAPVYVPNSKLADAAVTNFSSMTYRRIFWKISLVYSTTSKQLKQIRDEIEKYVLNNDDFVSPENAATFVRIDGFNESSIDIMLYCFTKTKVWGEWLKIKEELLLNIKSIVEDTGSSFAFPSRSLYIENKTTEG